MSKDKVNFAVIGCGMLAQSQHIPNIVNSKNMILHTCCDLSDEALYTCRDKFGALNISKDFDEVINNLDIDVI